MKKILALVMAIVMMMAIAVPAFAIDQNTAKEADGSQKGQVVVATTTSDADATYTVTYPASFTFAWDDVVAKDANYSVTSQLPIGASLKVSVAADNGAVMTSDVAVGPDYGYDADYLRWRAVTTLHADGNAPF